LAVALLLTSNLQVPWCWNMVTTRPRHCELCCRQPVSVLYSPVQMVLACRVSLLHS